LFIVVVGVKAQKKACCKSAGLFYIGTTIRRSDLQIETASAPPVIVVLSHAVAKMCNQNDNCKDLINILR
jgi:hypothetical protein